MIAGQRQAGHHGLRRRGRSDTGRRQGIAHDAVVGLGIDIVFIDCDSGAARVAIRLGRAETGNVVGLAVMFSALQGDQERIGPRGVAAIVTAAPGVGIDYTVRRYGKVPDVTEIVGEYGGAKAGRQGDAAIVARARRRLLGMGRRHGE